MQFKKPTSLADTFSSPIHDTWNSNSINSDETYAVANEQTLVKRFRVISKEACYSFSYALLPTCILKNGELYIKSYGIFIHLKGKGLYLIEQHICSETLVFVRESQGICTDEEEVFVSEITVKGKNANTSISEEEL